MPQAPTSPPPGTIVCDCRWVQPPSSRISVPSLMAEVVNNQFSGKQSAVLVSKGDLVRTVSFEQSLFGAAVIFLC